VALREHIPVTWGWELGLSARGVRLVTLPRQAKIDDRGQLALNPVREELFNTI